MKHPYILYFLLPPLLLQSCKSRPAEASAPESGAAAQVKQLNLAATTTHKLFYDALPSASGLEHAEGAFYVVGDDSPFLYELNGKYEQVRRHALFDTTGVVQGRIPKDVKPDLESMAAFTYGRDQMLLLLGSGASQARTKGYLVNLSEKMQVQELDLKRFYTFLKQVLKLESEGQLNLEGLAMDKVYTYMLQRPLGGGTNTLLRFNSDDFKDFILVGGEMPAVAVYHFSLPQLGGLAAGFSGAYALNGRLFFTASVEEAPNAIEDGEVHGSYIGVIDLRALPYATDAAQPLQVPVVQLNDVEGAPYVGKVESLVVLKAEGQTYQVVVVSDDDRGHSELLEVELSAE
ncbi:DUF6929 family protein [Pontibacter mangrovi]|uniref:Uncharacterized protein n=1 Tax=Pontibacter mangrovi TaxID=2589816 RepID=A0A501W501_9BACT|nr:hypothetical protein [Pontibacter mangrovi]TPE43872.1 hypothetical protein FJM65_10595 [Pontibacter mangrovi]